MVKCPNCHGEGGELPIPYGEICYVCDGTGKVSQSDRMKWVRSHKVKDPLRLALDKALELVKK